MDKIKTYIENIRDLIKATSTSVAHYEQDSLVLIEGDFNSGKISAITAAYLLGQVHARVYNNNYGSQRTSNKKPTPRGWLSQ